MERSHTIREQMSLKYPNESLCQIKPWLFQSINAWNAKMFCSCLTLRRLQSSSKCVNPVAIKMNRSGWGLGGDRCVLINVREKRREFHWPVCKTAACYSARSMASFSPHSLKGDFESPHLIFVCVCESWGASSPCFWTQKQEQLLLRKASCFKISVSVILFFSQYKKQSTCVMLEIQCGCFRERLCINAMPLCSMTKVTRGKDVMVSPQRDFEAHKSTAHGYQSVRNSIFNEPGIINQFSWTHKGL